MIVAHKRPTDKMNPKKTGILNSMFTGAWILQEAIPLIREYDTALTLRALHYLLVAKGMYNDIVHYKKICATLAEARWDGTLDFDAFVDYDRTTIGSTMFEPTYLTEKVTEAKNQIKAWATEYSKNKWENQPFYVEVFIEKKTLIGLFQDPCLSGGVALNACKGYPSITYLNDAKERFEAARDAGKEPVILYFGDYDCTGEDIPRSIVESLQKMGCEIELKRVLLTKDQVVKWKLPPAPTKESDSRAATWDGLGQVELDAVNPRTLQKMIAEAIEKYFDAKLYRQLKATEATERSEFKTILLRDFKDLLN